MKMISVLAAVLVVTGCATPRHQSNVGMDRKQLGNRLGLERRRDYG